MLDLTGFAAWIRSLCTPTPRTLEQVLYTTPILVLTW